VGGHLYSAVAMDGDGYIPKEKVHVLADAVNEACDALDGVKGWCVERSAAVPF